MESRIEILDRLAKKWSSKENCTPVHDFEQWLSIYDADATIQLVYIAMQEYANQENKVTTKD